jgi:hypothetical protein
LPGRERETPKQEETTVKKITLAVAGVLSLLFLDSIAADAACGGFPKGRWSVAGDFQLEQSNGFIVRCSLNQEVRGFFSGSCVSGGNGGSAEGRIQRSGKFNMQVDWDGNALGNYTAFINAKGKAEDGRTFDESAPNNFATWTLVKRLKECRAR